MENTIEKKLEKKINALNYKCDQGNEKQNNVHL